MTNSRISFGSSLTLSTLALLWPLAANASDANSLTCKMGSPNTVITNDGPATLPAGTKIVVRFYPGAGIVGSMKQSILRLNSDLPSGVDTSFLGERPGFYRMCTARVAAS